jgi:EmrB/QacA subfamily drug resistance transporter
VRASGVESAQTPSPAALAIFVVTALGAFMGSLDLSIVNIAFTALERTFSSSPRSTITWVVSGYAIAFGSLLVVAGRTADRLGARRVFFVGLAVFCGASALCGLAPTLPLLIAGRVLQGFGAAAVLPSSLGLLLASVPLAKRTVAVARWAGVGALAVATGPTLGGLLVTAGGWRWVFYVNLPIGLITWLAGRVVLPKSTSDASHAAPDYVGALLAFLSLGALVLAITEGSVWGWTSAEFFGCVAGSIVVGVAFVARCGRHPEPVLDLQLFKSRSFSFANTAMVLYAMGFFAMLLGNILFLQAVWHYSVLKAGLAVTPGPLVVATVASFAGSVANRVGFRRVLLVGCASVITGLVLLVARTTAHPDFPSVWLPSMLLTGFGIGCTFPVLGASAVSSLPKERFSVGSAVNQTARQVGGSIGIALLVVILGSENVVPTISSFHWLWCYAAGMAGLSGLVCLLLPAKRAALAPIAKDTWDKTVVSVPGVATESA